VAELRRGDIDIKNGVMRVTRAVQSAPLSKHFHVFAVDLRGQGRSTWTPGRYTIDNFGNDLVRFMDLVICEPAIVSGLSSGGVISTWLAAYAKLGQVRAAVLEDPPLFSSELTPAYGPGIRQSLQPVFAVWHEWLGRQWSIGDWEGAVRALESEVPAVLGEARAAMANPNEEAPTLGHAPQNMREYDPEWAYAFASGDVSRSCDHSTMLSQVRVPVLFTHHFRRFEGSSQSTV